jgi:hypothetical protein
MKQTNNENKSTIRPIFPNDLEKCFFAIENEFQDFEKKFLIHHIERRSNFRFKDPKSLNRIGVEWMIWYLDLIWDELKTPGQVLSTVITAKMKAGLTQQRRCDLNPWERHKILQYVNSITIK